ncbi:MAG: O-antigen polysaccharide polymerase Wzy [Aristaeellaceae bacterium]
MMKTKNMLILTGYVIVSFLCFMTHNAVVYVLALIGAWIHGLVYSLQRLRYRFALFSFYIGFFVFMMGGMLVSWAINGDFSYFKSTPEAMVHTCLCLFLSIVSINVTTVFVHNKQKESRPRRKQTALPGNRVPQAMRYIIIGLLIVGFCCELLVEIRTTIAIRASTYALSMSIDVGLPSIIIHMASLYYIALFMYWALMPSRCGVYLSSMSLLLIEGIILLSGERGEPM